VGRRGLILVDLNDTLICEDKAIVTIEARLLVDAVRQAERRGWQVGLCSDSPHEPLKAWGQRHGIGGIVVAENGAAVGGRPLVRFDGEPIRTLVREWASANRVAILERPALAREFGGYQAASAGIAFGEGRQCSVALFCFDSEGAVAQELTSAVGASLIARFGDAVDVGPDSGFVAVHSSGDFRTMKGLTLRRIARRLPAGRQLVMIGNSCSDLIGDHEVGQTWLVANATEAAKSKADRVLTLAHTEGVIEGLELLSRS
jgi:hypothetical protein